MLTATEALARLRAGNTRFVEDSADAAQRFDAHRRKELVEGQSPFAIVLGCADSRVPVEAVFDQGPGALFVVRVAGNIAAPSQVSSIEFAGEQFGARLVVVLGHSGCGAVRAVLADLANPEASPAVPPAIGERIRPTLTALVQAQGGADAADLEVRAVRANITAVARQLRDESEVLARLGREAGLRVVGAEYHLETGAVDFFDLGA